MFGSCFLTVAVFIKSLTDCILSSYFKGVCSSLLCLFCRYLWGLKDLNSSWIKQGLKIEGWQQILQDKVGFNLSIQGKVNAKFQWNHHDCIFMQRWRKGRELGLKAAEWQQFFWDKVHTHLMVEKDHWWLGSSLLLSTMLCSGLGSRYHACATVIISWSLFQTLTALGLEHDLQLLHSTSENSQKSNRFYGNSKTQAVISVTAAIGKA